MTNTFIAKIITGVSFVVLPVLAFANGGGMDTAGYFTEHVGDIPILFLVLVSAGFAFLVAKIYGGIIGTMLKFTSAGLLVVVLHNTLESFEHADVSVLSHDAGIILDIVGFALIAFGMFQFYSETKKKIPGTQA